MSREKAIKKSTILSIFLAILFTVAIGLVSYVFFFQFDFVISRLALLKAALVGFALGAIYFSVSRKTYVISERKTRRKWGLVSLILSLLLCLILAFTIDIPNNYLFTPTMDIVIETPPLNEGGGPITINYIYDSYTFIPSDEVTLLQGAALDGTSIHLTPGQSSPAQISWNGRVWDRVEFEFTGYQTASKVFFYQGKHLDSFYFPEGGDETVTTVQVHNFFIFDLLSQAATLLAFFAIVFLIFFPSTLFLGDAICQIGNKAYFWLAGWLKTMSEEERGRIAAKGFLWVGIIFFTFWLLNYARVLLVDPNPAEFREGANLVMTEYILKGENPFALEHQPLLNTNKGFVYNYTVLPLAMLFGNTLFIHRFVSIFFIILSCVLISLALRKMQIPAPFAIAGGNILFACLLYYVSPIARVDGMGTFLFLAAILIPWFAKFNTASLVASGIISIMAFYTKPYFVLCYGIVTAYLFLFHSKKKGFWYGLIILLILVASIFLVNNIFECYFLHTVINSSSIAGISGSIAYLFRQLFRFVRVLWPIGLIFLIHLIHQRENLEEKQAQLKTPFWKNFNLRDANQPFFSTFDIGYFETFFLISTAAIVFLLGLHRGNYMVYLFQLMVPPFILLIFRWLTLKFTFVQITSPLIILNLTILSFFLLYPNNPNAYVEEWDILNSYVEESNHILNTPLLAPKMLQEGMTVIDSGSSGYFYRTKPYADTYFAPSYAEVEQQGLQYKQLIEDQVRSHYFDHVIITKSPSYNPFIDVDVLSKYYEMVQDIILYLPQSNETWDIQIWDPLPK